MSGQILLSRPDEMQANPVIRRCYRHARGVWMAHCSDCTAWYLGAEIARRSSVTFPLAA
jgi:hypothetical protein